MARLPRLPALLALAAVTIGCGDDDPEVRASAAQTDDAAMDHAETAAAAQEEAPAGNGDSDVAVAIREAATGDHRSEANIARNEYRRPVETLTFFGLEPDMTVVEVWPGGAGAWYTEVLAPVLAEEGQLVAATYPMDSESEYQANAARAYRQKLDERPEIYGNVEVVAFAPPEHTSLGEPGNADMVLMTRILHNVVAGGALDTAMDAAFEALEPGGVLAIVQHREPEDAPPETEERDGYVRESTVVEAAEAAGFELDARSEINANPADTADHEMGVWTLPPNMALCQDMEGEEREACEEKWQEIGESDRMTLRFVKPESTG